jgi:hypothetical protein
MIPGVLAGYTSKDDRTSRDEIRASTPLFDSMILLLILRD